MGVTFHRISPPTFIQTWLQQYSRRTFFHSAHCSFSNTISLRSVWCRRAMIPGEIFTSFAEFHGIVRVNDFRIPFGFQELWLFGPVGPTLSQWLRRDTRKWQRSSCTTWKEEGHHHAWIQHGGPLLFWMEWTGFKFHLGTMSHLVCSRPSLETRTGSLGSHVRGGSLQQQVALKRISAQQRWCRGWTPSKGYCWGHRADHVQWFLSPLFRVLLQRRLRLPLPLSQRIWVWPSSRQPWPPPRSMFKDRGSGEEGVTIGECDRPDLQGSRRQSCHQHVGERYGLGSSCCRWQSAVRGGCGRAPVVWRYATCNRHNVGVKRPRRRGAKKRSRRHWRGITAPGEEAQREHVPRTQRPKGQSTFGRRGAGGWEQVVRRSKVLRGTVGESPC